LGKTAVFVFNEHLALNIEIENNHFIPDSSSKKQPCPSSGVALQPGSVIQPGQESLIEIDKGGLGLGLSIVGGSDTVLGTVVIHEVYPDGAAAKDGRLEPGDQVLEVSCKICFVLKQRFCEL